MTNKISLRATISIIFLVILLLTRISSAQNQPEIPVVSPTVPAQGVTDAKDGISLKYKLLGVKGFYNVNGEIVKLKYLKVIEMREYVPIERKYWAIYMAPAPLTNEIDTTTSEPRKILAKIPEYAYFELRSMSKEIGFYQLAHRGLKEPVSGSDYPQNAFELKYEPGADGIVGFLGFNDYLGGKDRRHLVKAYFKGPLKVVQVGSPQIHQQQPVLTNNPQQIFNIDQQIEEQMRVPSSDPNGGNLQQLPPPDFGVPPPPSN